MVWASVTHAALCTERVLLFHSRLPEWLTASSHSWEISIGCLLTFRADDYNRKVRQSKRMIVRGEKGVWLTWHLTYCSLCLIYFIFLHGVGLLAQTRYSSVGKCDMRFCIPRLIDTFSPSVMSLPWAPESIISSSSFLFSCMRLILKVGHRCNFTQGIFTCCRRNNYPC